MHKNCSTTAKFQTSLKSKQFYLIHIITQYLRNKSPYKTRPHPHHLSTVLSLNSILKCWGRPQLRKFSNHRHQHSWVYTQLSKIFMFSQPHFFQGYKWFHEMYKVHKMKYIQQEWCLLRNEYMLLSNFSFTSV